jgi:hypothetical protein
MTEQTAVSAPALSSQGTYDRARGGVLEITFTIPPEIIMVENYKFPNGNPATGQVTTNRLEATIEIDWELLPLVDVAGYTIEEEQIGPAVLPYPPDKINVDFS